MSSEVTLSQICELNLSRAKRINRPTSHRSYECHNRLFKSVWGDRPAASITRIEVQELMMSWRGEYTAATIGHRICFLCGAYNLAIDQGLLETNPAARLKYSKKHKRHQWLSFEQEAQMRQAYHAVWGPELGEFWWSAERFAILTGVRLGEQAYLQPRHLTPTVLTIPDEGKTGTRQVPLHPEALQIAQDWSSFSASLGSPYIFWPVAGDRNVVGQQWALDVWRLARKVAGLVHFWSRDRRRTFATRCIRVAGMGIYEVMILLGHSNVEQTRTYCQIELIDLSEGILRLK